MEVERLLNLWDVQEPAGPDVTSPIPVLIPVGRAELRSFPRALVVLDCQSGAKYLSTRAKMDPRYRPNQLVEQREKRSADSNLDGALPNFSTMPSFQNDLSLPDSNDGALVDSYMAIGDDDDDFSDSPTNSSYASSESLGMESFTGGLGTEGGGLGTEGGDGVASAILNNLGKKALGRSQSKGQRERASPYQGGSVGTSTQGGGLKMQRKLRKNTREKQRRLQLNDKFEQLCKLLHLGRKSKAEKFTILSEAINHLVALREENSQLKQERQELQAQMQRLSQTLQQQGVKIPGLEQFLQNVVSQNTTPDAVHGSFPASNVATPGSEQQSPLPMGFGSGSGSTPIGFGSSTTFPSSNPQLHPPSGFTPMFDSVTSGSGASGAFPNSPDNLTMSTHGGFGFGALTPTSTSGLGFGRGFDQMPGFGGSFDNMSVFGKGENNGLPGLSGLHLNNKAVTPTAQNKQGGPLSILTLESPKNLMMPPFSGTSNFGRLTSPSVRLSPASAARRSPLGF
eukprot:g71664.t1